MPNFDMTLKQYRAKYPEYDSIPDDALSKKLYEKYGKPEALKESAFYRNIDYKPHGTLGWKGVREDLAKKAGETPGDVANLTKALFTVLPQEAMKSGKQIATHPIRAAENLGAGVGEGVIGGINLPGKLISYLSDKEVLPKVAGEAAEEVLQIPDLGIEKKLGLDEPQEGDALLRGIGQFTPYGRIGRASKGLKGIAKRGAAAGLAAAAQGENPLSGGASVFAGEGLGKALGRQLQKDKKMPTQLNPEQLRRNLRATEGTETNLGRVLENKGMAEKFENQLTQLEGTGANEMLARNKHAIRNRVENLLEEFNPEDLQTKDFPEDILSDLQSGHQEVKAKKNAKFDTFRDIADHVTHDRDNLTSTARQLKNKLEDDTQLASGKKRDLLKTVEDFAKPAKNKSLPNSVELQADINTKLAKAHNDLDKNAIFYLNRLKDGLQKDINSAMDNTGNKGLRHAYDDFMEYYQKEFIPWEDRDIRKFTELGGDADQLITHFVRAGERDRPNLLGKLTDKLSPESNEKLNKLYYSPVYDEYGEVRPTKFRKLSKQLGPEQKKKMVQDPELRERMRDTNRLIDLNSRSLHDMYNPKTGYALLNFIEKHLPMALGGIAGATQGPVPGMMGAALFAPMIRGALGASKAKKLTSPAYREKYVNDLIKKMEKGDKSAEKELGKFMSSLSEQTGKAAIPTMNLPEVANADN